MARWLGAERSSGHTQEQVMYMPITELFFFALRRLKFLLVCSYLRVGSPREGLSFWVDFLPAAATVQVIKQHPGETEDAATGWRGVLFLPAPAKKCQV